MDARPIGDVLIDRLRERVGLLAHHAHTGAKMHHVHAGHVDILAVQRDVAFATRAFHGVVHPAERPQHGGLATPRLPPPPPHLAPTHLPPALPPPPPLPLPHTPPPAPHP